MTGGFSVPGSTRISTQWATARTAGFDVHRGCEANLPTALEAMTDTGLRFARSGIAQRDGAWLRAARLRCDRVNGGIAILDTHTRTRGASGRRAMMFTSGHVPLRRSLPVRAEDSGRLAPPCQPEGRCRLSEN